MVPDDSDEDEVPNITKAEFHERVYQKGEKLVILDEYVLDVSEFISKHPGGRFALEHSIGRDVSKYFYGGYSVDGNVGRDHPRAAHVHSNDARRIINELIVAYYEREVEKTSTVCKLN